MHHKKLLEYYRDCLLFEKYFSTKLSKKQVLDNSIDLSISKQEKHVIPDKILRLIDTGKPDKNTSYFVGYPLVKIGINSYYPIAIWELNLSSNNILPNGEIHFHQNIHEGMSDNILGLIKNITDEISKNPAGIFESHEVFNNIISVLDLKIDTDYLSPVIFKGEIIRAIDQNYNISNELNNLIEKKQLLAPVAEAYLSGDMSNVNTLEHIYHIVPSNYPQNKAIMNQSELITVIQGPPGTGKTQAIMNLIANQLINNKTVLISSTNNKAVDNIIEKYTKENLDSIYPGVIRLGNKKTIEESDFMEGYNDLIQIDEEFDINTNTIEINKLKNQSRTFWNEISRFEQSENDFNNLADLIEKYEVLQNQILHRIRSIFSDTKIKEFKEISLSIPQLESLLLEMLIKPDLDNPSTIIKKIIYIIMCKLFKTKHPLLKLKLIKLLKHTLYFNEIWNYIDEEDAITPLAQLHDLVRYTNISNMLLKYNEQLESLKQYIIENKDLIPLIYDNKIENDRELLKLIWKSKIYTLVKDDNKMKDIKNCLDSLDRWQKLTSNDKKSFNSFQELFPCLLTSNLSTRRTIPYGCNYDLVVIDEASQCAITSVFSLLDIARKVYFIGDDKQLTHITSIDNNTDNKLWNKHIEILDMSQYSYPSVTAFDRAINSIGFNSDKKHFLHYHYRCIHPIINFSNKHYYSNSLRVLTKDKAYESYPNGIYFENIEGQATDNVNKAEIDRIKKIVFNLNNSNNSITNDREKIKTIGVITPFRNQANALNKELRNIALVGTIHTFQGGECDAIIFSSVISNGSTDRQIGFVQSNSRLINVAVTRAKKLFIAVGDENTILSDKGHLTHLVNYIKSISDVEFKQIPIKMSMISEEIGTISSRKRLMNPGEERIYNLIKKSIENKSILIFPKIPVKDTFYMNLDNLKYNLKNYYFTSHFDFVLYDKDSLIPLFAVEYDGESHRRDKDTIERDKKKNDLCYHADFELIRISSSNEQEGWNSITNYLNKNI